MSKAKLQRNLRTLKVQVLDWTLERTVIHQSVTEHISSVLAPGSSLDTGGLAGSKARFLGGAVEEKREESAIYLTQPIGFLLFLTGSRMKVLDR